MNTVKIGDDFESKSKKLIKKIIDNYELSVIPAHCTVHEKKEYYSYKREKKIKFDLSIEVRHPNADKPTTVYIIECKSLGHRVPVDDIEEFESKVGGLTGFQTKKVMIARNGFQEGVHSVAKNLGVMLIDVDNDDYEIILYKPDKLNKNQESNIDDEIEKLIKSALLPNKIEGLKRLSSEAINDIAAIFLNDFDSYLIQGCLKTPLDKIQQYLEDKMSIKTDYSNYLTDDFGNELLGYFDVKNKTILIDKSIVGGIRFPFVYAHEIGHLILHSKLKANQFVYDNFRDSGYSLFTEKHKLMNDKNWIEWQANCFAACLLMPKKSFITRLVSIQLAKGISKQGKIYLDHQRINQKDFQEIVEELSIFFGVSRVSVEYRLYSLNLIEKPKLSEEVQQGKEFLRRLSIMSNKNI